MCQTWARLTIAISVTIIIITMVVMLDGRFFHQVQADC